MTGPDIKAFEPILLVPRKLDGFDFLEGRKKSHLVRDCGDKGAIWVQARKQGRPATQELEQYHQARVLLRDHLLQALQRRVGGWSRRGLVALKIQVNPELTHQQHPIELWIQFDASLSKLAAWLLQQQVGLLLRLDRLNWDTALERSSAFKVTQQGIIVLSPKVADL